MGPVSIGVEVQRNTDGDTPSINKPGLTGAGGVVYMDGYNSTPVLLKKGVSPHSNNYTGELVGIHISLHVFG